MSFVAAELAVEFIACFHVISVRRPPRRSRGSLITGERREGRLRSSQGDPTEEQHHDVRH